MSAGSVSRRRGLARLAAVLSLRTISGKLIVGIVVLFGLASLIVSLITAQSLNNSLMSSLGQQLQGATHTWYNCVEQSTHDSPGSDDAGRPDSDGYGMCSELGQEPGTFEELLTGTSVGYKHIVQKACRLTTTDAATLVKLPPGSTAGSPGRFRGVESARSRAGRAAREDLHPDLGFSRG